MFYNTFLQAIMGIGLTLQDVEGWQGQYERMLRWHDRFKREESKSNSPDALDFVLVLLHQAYHLRDWIANDLPSEKANLQSLFKNSVELRICRDITNGFKHKILNETASIDRKFTIVSEYNPQGQRHDPIILAGPHQLTLVKLADTCVDEWRKFVKDMVLRNKLPPTESPN